MRTLILPDVDVADVIRYENEPGQSVLIRLRSMEMSQKVV
jgi:hypothetical protein